MLRKGIRLFQFFAAVLLISILVGCQSETPNNSSENEEENETKKQLEKEDDIITKDNLTFSLEEVNSDTADSKAYTFTVKNEGDKKETLSFTTSQRYEYILSNKEDGVVERFSDGKASMQVLEEIDLTNEESLSYDITLSDLEPGAYNLEVYLTARNMSENKVTTSFIINEE